MSQDPLAFPLPFLVRDHLRFEGAAVFDLELLTAADTAIALEITGFTREGPFIFRHTTLTNSTLTSTTFRIPDVPIWISVKYVSTGSAPNQVYALLYVRVNQVRMALLGQGTLSPYYGISWPNPPAPVTMQTRGALVDIATADPAAGANMTHTIPAGEYWLIRGVGITLVTDATVATRRVTLVINTPNSTVLYVPSTAGQTASLTWNYSWWVGASSIDNSGHSRLAAPLPGGLFLPPTSIIETQTQNLQAGDNFGVGRIYIEKHFLAFT